MFESAVHAFCMRGHSRELGPSFPRCVKRAVELMADLAGSQAEAGGVPEEVAPVAPQGELATEPPAVSDSDEDMPVGAALAAAVPDASPGKAAGDDDDDDIMMSSDEDEAMPKRPGVSARAAVSDDDDDLFLDDAAQSASTRMGRLRKGAAMTANRLQSEREERQREKEAKRAAKKAAKERRAVKEKERAARKAAKSLAKGIAAKQAAAAAAKSAGEAAAGHAEGSDDEDAPVAKAPGRLDSALGGGSDSDSDASSDG